MQISPITKDKNFNAFHHHSKLHHFSTSKSLSVAVEKQSNVFLTGVQINMDALITSQNCTINSEQGVFQEFLARRNNNKETNKQPCLCLKATIKAPGRPACPRGGCTRPRSRVGYRGNMQYCSRQFKTTTFLNRLNAIKKKVAAEVSWTYLPGLGLLLLRPISCKNPL